MLSCSLPKCPVLPSTALEFSSSCQRARSSCGFVDTQTPLLGSCRGCLHVCLHKVSAHLPSDGAAPRLPWRVKDKVSKGQRVPVLRAGGAKGLAGCSQENPAEQASLHRLPLSCSKWWGSREPEPFTAPFPNGEVCKDPLLSFPSQRSLLTSVEVPVTNTLFIPDDF